MMVSAQEEHDNELYNFILLRLSQRTVVFLLIVSTRVMRIVHIVVASKIQPYRLCFLKKNSISSSAGQAHDKPIYNGAPPRAPMK